MRSLRDAGTVPPDVLMGMSLFLLVNQPRRPRKDERRPRGAVSGGVWVREQVTIHRPVRIGQTLVVEGESARRFTRRGRRYGVTLAETRDLDGNLLVSNCTTGLLRYRKDESLPDEAEGRAEDELAIAGPAASQAPANPHLDTLTCLEPGSRFEGERSLVSLEMMQARDAQRDANRIHTDPEVARREGLAAPIAGGSHVAAFLLETLTRACGQQALLHGAHLDIQWKAQTYAGTHITPRAVVERATPELVELSLIVEGEERTALEGKLYIPLKAHVE
jgi:acyl dehydratase